MLVASIPGAGLESPTIIRSAMHGSIIVTDADDRREAVAALGLAVHNFSRYAGQNGIEILGRNRYAGINSLAAKRLMLHESHNSVVVGGPIRSHSLSALDVVGGDSILIMADIVSAGLQGTSGENNIQIIDIGEATGGVWSIWLTYGGFVLETDDLAYNASALDVQNALLALDNVPSATSILVTGLAGGPYTVEFRDQMGLRYIAPLVLEYMALTGGIGVLVEVEQSGTPNGTFADVEVNAIVRVNDVEVPISAFEYQEPTAKLGSILNVTLARPDVSLIPVGASIDFSLTANGVERPYIVNGRLSSRDYRQVRNNEGGPKDEVVFGVIDVVADRVTLAPRRPVIMFDPTRVNFSEVEVRAGDRILDSSGRPIMPVYEYYPGLTMKQVLRRAYTGHGGYGMMGTLTPSQQAAMSGIQQYLSTPTTDQIGLGFANVFTNIPNYPVKRADFTIEAGWHKGAEPTISMYEPLQLPFGNVLYILNIEFPLPFGSLPRVITMSEHQLISQTVPFKSDANAVLLTYQVSASDDPSEEMFITREYEYPDGPDGKQEGEGPGATRTYTRIRYLRKKMSETLEVVAEEIEESYVETRTDFSGEGFYTLSHRETLQNFYYDDLKTGHFKIVEGLMLVGAERSSILRTFIEEHCSISWKEDPVNLGQKIQTKSRTETSGLIYESTETFTRINPETGDEEEIVKRFPAIVAQKSGVMEDDGTLTFGVIETTEKTLRYLGGNQYDVSVVAINNITQTIDYSTTQPVTGDTSSNPFETRSKTKLYRDLASEAEIGPRIPLQVNAGELPHNRADALAKITLHRAKNPLNTTTMPLAYIDFGIGRGTVAVGQTRTGYTKKHIITGLTITGRNLGRTQGHRISMSVEGTELPEVAS